MMFVICRSSTQKYLSVWLTECFPFCQPVAMSSGTWTPYVPDGRVTRWKGGFLPIRNTSLGPDYMEKYTPFMFEPFGLV